MPRAKVNANTETKTLKIEIAKGYFVTIKDVGGDGDALIGIVIKDPVNDIHVDKSAMLYAEDMPLEPVDDDDDENEDEDDNDSD